MDITLTKITKSNKRKLEKLMQLYLHDLSMYFPIDFEQKTCKYNYDLDSYFDKNIAYFIKGDKNIIGFVLIDINDNNEFEISEIFILNNYKKKHAGGKAAIQIFDTFKGNWTIKAVPLSPVAETFWDNTIKKYTNNNYTKTHTGKYNRAEFYFSNK